MHEADFISDLNQVLAVCSKFVAKEIVPKALEADQRSDAEFVRELLHKLAEIGMLGILVPDEFGGAGMNPLAGSVILDVLSGGCASVSTGLAYHFCAQMIIQEGGSTEQKKRWLHVTTGANGEEEIFCSCVFPLRDAPSAGDTEVLALEKSGSGLLLDGRAGLVIGAGLADLLAVFVRPRGDVSEGPVTCVVVASDRAGIEIGRKESFSGLKALPINPVTFNRVSIAAEDMIGETGEAGGLLEQAQHWLGAFLGSVATGLGRSAYRKAFAYACERYQYGKTIVQHQEIQRMLGRMVTSLHAGTALYIQALSGARLEGICSAARGEYAKVFCTDAALEIAIDSIQIHGGYGYMQDYGVEKLMRDVKMLQLLEGRNPVLQMAAVRRELEKAGLGILSQTV